MASKYARRHYEDVANLLNTRLKSAMGSDAMEDHGSAAYFVERIIDDFADLFQKDNPNFDATRFMKACGF